MSPPKDAQSSRAKSTQARILGGSIAGIAEISVFHPIDTMVKRIMTNRKKLQVNDLESIKEIVFHQNRIKGVKSYPHPPALSSLFSGISYAYLYKIHQRGFQLAVQHEVRKGCDIYFRPETKFAKTTSDAVAGGVMGFFEVVMLPLNTIKIRAQTNREALPKSISILNIGNVFREIGFFGLYRGASWTAIRNVPGSFALFGGNSLTKEYFFGLEDHIKDATLFQNTVSSCVGSVMSILLSNPFDVVKTRLQSGLFIDESRGVRSTSGLQILGEVWRSEGFGGFFKGSFLKCCTVGPKLTFSYAIAQNIIGWCERGWM